MTKQELVYCNYDSKHNNLLTLKPKRTVGEAKCYTSEIKLNTMLASDHTWYMYLQLIQALPSLTNTHYFVYDELNHAYILLVLTTDLLEDSHIDDITIDDILLFIK